MWENNRRIAWDPASATGMWRNYLQQTGRLLQQSNQFWSAWRNFSRSCAETWMESAGGMAKTFNNNMKDLLTLYSPARAGALSERVNELQQQYQRTESELQQAIKQNADFKSTISKNQKSIGEQQSTIESQRREIADLNKKLQEQAAHLKALEAAAAAAAAKPAEAHKRTARAPKGEKKAE